MAALERPLLQEACLLSQHQGQKGIGIGITIEVKLLLPARIEHCAERTSWIESIFQTPSHASSRKSSPGSSRKQRASGTSAT